MGWTNNLDYSFIYILSFYLKKVFKVLESLFEFIELTNMEVEMY